MTTNTYEKLENLLANGEWKEADQETSKVMLQIADREEEGWLDIDSINKIPCEDLRTIDQLWVKYSNGRFGFSVQKKLWLIYGKVNNQKEYKMHNLTEIEYNRFQSMSSIIEREHKMNDLTGWRVNGEWIDYKSGTFSLLAPLGHLPYFVFGPYILSSFSKWFYSRIESCNL